MKKIVTIIFIISTAFLNATAQDYKIYFDSTDNKLYYNKKLPVYFWISDKPDDSGTDILLKSKVPKYANPYYFDTEGINTFRVKQPKGPFEEAVFEIWADDRPPIIKHYINSSNTYYKNNITYLGKNSIIKLHGIDGLSKVKNIYYSINNQKFKIYNEPIKISKSGTIVLKYFGCDIVGNCSDTIEKTFYGDITPPIVKPKITNSFCDTILGRKSKIEFIANDSLTGVSGIYYSLKEKPPYRRYNYPILLTQGTEGYHTLYYYAVDKVNNKTPIKRFKYYIDVTPPKVNFKIVGDYKIKNNIYYLSPNGKISLSATDNKKVHKIYYLINNKKQEYSNFIDLKNYYGLKTIFFYATDIAGNKSPTRSIRIFIDNTTPITRIIVGSPKFINRDTIFISSNTLISFAASDRYSKIKKIEYAINNSDFKKYTGKFLLKKEGFYNIFYRSQDELGNIEPTKVTHIYVDNTPPEIKIIFSVEPFETQIVGNDTIAVYPTNTKIYLGAKDSKTGEEDTYYSIDNGPFVLYRHPINFTLSSQEKLIKLTVKSKDKLGNEARKEIEFIIRKK